MELGLNSLLFATPTITNVVGSRIYPAELIEGSQFPALSYAVVSETESPTFETSGMKKARVEFNCWGASYQDAVTLRSAVLSALRGYQGALSDGTHVANVWLCGKADLFEHDLPAFRAMVELYILFT